MGGCKWRFLEQQIDLANTISPNLGKLLALFASDLASTIKPDARNMEELEQLLNNSCLNDATIQFCNRVILDYSFHNRLEAALKRTIWHHCIPDLKKVEAETLDEQFRTGLVDYLINPESSNKILHVTRIQKLGERVQEIVNQYLLSQHQ